MLDVGVPCPLVCTTHMHARTLIFLYCSVSTLKPIVGMVCTASSLSFCSLYRIVVLPALSNPKIKIRTSLDPNRVSKRRLIMIPMVDEYNFFPKQKAIQEGRQGNKQNTQTQSKQSFQQIKYPVGKCRCDKDAQRTARCFFFAPASVVSSKVLRDPKSLAGVILLLEK